MGRTYHLEVLAVDAIGRGYVGMCFDGSVHIVVGRHLALQSMHIALYSDGD